MKVLVTGANGLVGSAITRLAQNSEHTFLFTNGKKRVDFRDALLVNKLFTQYKPDYVIHTAAKVGGIGGNIACHGEYYYDNLLMNTNLIHSSYIHGVQKFIGFSSVCVFPDNIGTLSEDIMHNGQPSDFNFAYAYAKRMLDVQIEAYKRQYGIKNYCSIILTNTFGENDMYNLEYGHVIPSLIHKLYLAKRDRQPMIIWGDGSSSREFIYSGDVAKIILELIDTPQIPQRLIVSRNENITIREIVEKLVRISEFDGPVIYDTSKPNGQKARPTDISLLNNLVDIEYTDLDTALEYSWKWFVNNYPHVRQ